MALYRKDLHSYPYTDEHGYTWVDSGGFLALDGSSQACFECSKPTRRIDVDFHAYFCNSTACNQAIEAKLRSWKDTTS